MHPGADKGPVRGVTSVCSPAPSKYTLRGVLIAAGLGWAARLSGGDAAGVSHPHSRGPWVSSSARPGSPPSGGPAVQRQTPRARTPPSPLANAVWGLSSHRQARQPLEGGQWAARDPALWLDPVFLEVWGRAWGRRPALQSCSPAGAPRSLRPSFPSDEGRACFWGFS